MIFGENILEQYNFKRQLQQSKLGIELLIEKTPVAIVVLQEEKIAYANPAATLIVGRLQSQFLNNLNFCHQPNCSEIFEIQMAGGKKYWLKCWREVIEWKCQRAVMITAVNITKYKQEEAETRQALTVEKARCQNKTKFVSMVSHEFRTPLNIISFSTSLLKRHLNQWNEIKQLKYLDRLQTAVEQLASLMDEILIIGRAEAGKLKFAPELLDLDLFCRNLLTEINLSYPDKVKINFVNKVEKKLLADKNLLKLVLANLLGNAMKYSPADRPVEFTVSRDNEQIVFQIVDRGIGIIPDEQPKIFEPFHRGENVGDLPGNGLGLAIAEKVVELQGGQISLESQVNIGSTFTVKIPLELP